MALAIFDLDETLISSDSDHEWGQYVGDAGLVDAKAHQRQNDIFYQQYKAGEFDETLLTILHNYEKVTNLILPTLGEERRKTYSPFLPICPKSVQSGV